MMVGFLVLAIACFVFWLVFLRLKLLRMTPGWVFGFSLVILHLMLIFVIGVRFVTPMSASATVVQHTIQLIPRLSGPTMVTAVLVEENTPVKKDQPLFQFDRTVYESNVAEIEAQLAAARQNVKVLKADIEVAMQKTARTLSQLTFYQYEKGLYDKLVKQNSAAAGDVQLWRNRVDVADASHLEAVAELDRANLNYRSDSVNHIIAVEQQPTRRRKACENMAQRCTITASDVGNPRHFGEIIGCSNCIVPIIGEICHHGIETARFVLVGAQVFKPAHFPRNLIRHSANHGFVELFPGAPRPRRRPETRGMVHAVWRISTQQPRARRMPDFAICVHRKDAERGERSENAV